MATPRQPCFIFFIIFFTIQIWRMPSTVFCVQAYHMVEGGCMWKPIIRLPNIRFPHAAPPPPPYHVVGSHAETVEGILHIIIIIINKGFLEWRRRRRQQQSMLLAQIWRESLPPRGFCVLCACVMRALCVCVRVMCMCYVCFIVCYVRYVCVMCASMRGRQHAMVSGLCVETLIMGSLLWQTTNILSWHYTVQCV